jgi:nucleoside-diphosphate-sugar epimerase
MMARRAVIVGGTGQIGRRLAVDLIAEGWDVTVTARGGKVPPAELVAAGVAFVAYDRNAEPLGAVVAGADLVVDMVAFTQEHGRQLLEIAPNVGKLVVISSSSVYCDSLGRSLDEARENGFPDIPHAMTETQSVLPPSDDNYSTRKVALERVLLDGAKGRVTILRPCAIYGVGSANPREWWMVKRMLDGRNTIPLAFGGASRFHTTSVDNISAVVRLVAENEGPEILNVGDTHCVTTREIGQALADALGRAMRFVDGGDAYPSVMGASPWSIPAPFMIDSSAAMALGYQPKSYADCVGPMVQWLSDIHAIGDWQHRFPGFASEAGDQFNYAAEDAYLAA